MSSRFRTVGVVSGILTALLASGCSSSRHESTESYYLLASNIKLPYWQKALAGLRRGANDLKVKADMAGPDTYNAQEERDMFRHIVSKKPSGIMVSVADPGIMKDEINAAIAAGIPVITIDSDAPDSQRLLFIGTNNYQAGITGGEILAKQMNGRGNVAVFTIPAQANLAERLRGYESALAGTQIKIAQTIDIRGDPTVAFDKTMEIVNNNKGSVDGFICLEATAGKEVADVLSRQKVTGKTIVAMDTDDGTLDWIEKGQIAATVAQKPFTMAYYGLRVLDDLHHNKPAKLDMDWGRDLESLMPSVIDTGSALIDKANLGTFRKAVAMGQAPLPPALAWLDRGTFGKPTLRR